MGERFTEGDVISEVEDGVVGRRGSSTRPTSCEGNSILEGVYYNSAEAVAGERRTRWEEVVRIRCALLGYLHLRFEG
jgi:hypothetical protein